VGEGFRMRGIKTHHLEMHPVSHDYLAFVDDQLYNAETGYYNLAMQKKINLSDTVQSIIKQLIPD